MRCKDRYIFSGEILDIEFDRVVAHILVTDAVGPAIGEVELDHLPDDRVVLKGGIRLAGSGLRMDVAITNTVRRAGLTLREAVTMATINPARVGRVRGRLRGLQPGERADLVRFQWEGGQMRVLETYLSGERVFGGSDSCSQPGISY
jgi:N-acetylglucosamine-6-phosphate deacetylase